MSEGSVYSWCGCRDERTGRRLGARCPHRGEPGHGSWYLSVELPPGPGGDRRRIRRGGFAAQAEARAAMEQLLVPPPGQAAGGPLTTGQWLRHWIAGRATPRYSTVRGYESHVRLYLIPYLGSVVLADLQPAHVQAMLTAISRAAADRDRPLAASTLARIHATLRAALNAAIRAGHLPANPASRTELPGPARRPRAVIWTTARIADWQQTGRRPAVAVWTPAQTAAFLNSARDDRLYALWHLIALRGLRRGEAAGLRWRDIDLDTATILICQQLQQYAGHLALSRPKTASSERAVVLDHTTTGVMRRHRAAQQTEQAAAGPAWHDTGYAFTTCHGDPVAPDWLTRHFRELSAAAGLPPVRLHDLRHGAASLALAAGADLRTIQDQLGHSSIVLTADTYISVLPDLARDTAEDTARLIIAAGLRPPGTARVQRPYPNSSQPRKRPAGASHARPARQISRPRPTIRLPDRRPYHGQPPPLPGPATSNSGPNSHRSGWVGRLGIEPRTGGL
jgi:integrase